MPASHPRPRALAVGIAAFALVAVAAGGTLAASTDPPTALRLLQHERARSRWRPSRSASSPAAASSPTGARRASPGPPAPQGTATGATGVDGTGRPGSATNIVNVLHRRPDIIARSGSTHTTSGIQCDGGVRTARRHHRRIGGGAVVTWTRATGCCPRERHLRPPRRRSTAAAPSVVDHSSVDDRGTSRRTGRGPRPPARLEPRRTAAVRASRHSRGPRRGRGPLVSTPSSPRPRSSPSR